MNEKYLKKISAIKKEYKHTNSLLEMTILNYHQANIYIRLDYYKKLNSYKISWLDLDDYQNNFDALISYEYVPVEVATKLTEIISKIPDNEESQIQKDEFLVTIDSSLKTAKGTNFHLSFSRYLPTTNRLYLDILSLLFDSLPKRLNGFGEEMAALFFGNRKKYEYQEEIQFDLFNGDLNALFEWQIQERGEVYHQEGRVLFLEKIADSYIAVVGGSALYATIIKYNEVARTIMVSCSCPCEYMCKHLYAVILAIRNSEYRKLYKLTRKNDQMPLLDRIMNFHFLLSIGIDDQGNNYLIIEDGQIKLLPVKNSQGKSDWIILEDDEQETLTKRLKEII